MPIDRVVINASPLILLFNSEMAFILPELFEEILVPEAVWNEIVNSPGVDKAAQMISTTGWLNKTSVSPAPEVVRWDLGSGETEVLSYAFVHTSYTPILDDSAAKKCAISLGLRTIGTGSILILAKEANLINSVERSLVKLRNSGMWISDHVIKLLKEKAGE